MRILVAGSQRVKYVWLSSGHQVRKGYISLSKLEVAVKMNLI